MSSAVGTNVVLEVRLGRLLAQARTANLPGEDISFLENLFEPDKIPENVAIQVIEEIRRRVNPVIGWNAGVSYRFNDETYTPESLAKLISSYLKRLSRFVSPKERVYLRDAKDNLESSHLVNPFTAKQAVYLGTILSTIEQRPEEGKIGAVFTRLFSRPNVFVTRIINYSQGRGFTSDYQPSQGDVNDVFQKKFRKEGVWEKFSDDLLLHVPLQASRNHEPLYKSALGQLKDFFGRIDPTKHEIVALGYARKV